MIWNQSYLLFGHGLAFSFALAALPLVTMLVMLGVFRKPAWIAGLCGFGVALALATLGYRMPVHMALGAAAYGVAFGLFPITWIILWAITLFRVTVEAGQFEIIKDSIGRLTPDSRLQALLIAFAFGGFLEGAAGFGTPVAIAATMLIGLGFSAYRASAICLLTNTAPVAFGSIGIAIFTLAGTTGLPLAKLSGAVGAICTPISFIIPVYMIIALGGIRAMRGIWFPTILAGTVFGAVQLFVSFYLGPQLTDILAALMAMMAVVILLRIWKPKTPDALNENGIEASQTDFTRSKDEAKSGPAARVAIPNHPIQEVLYAWTPYALLVACVLLWGWVPVQNELSKATLLIKWPYLHDLVQRVPPIVVSPSPYHAVFTLNWLAAAGTACMVATLLSVAFLRISVRQFLKILYGVLKQLRLPTATVSSVLAIAFLMNYCGATATLGLAFSATGVLFPLFSALLGWVGVFLTGSDTSANALFGNLQVVTAERLGFSPILMAASNSAGGVMGKMISLQTIAIAAGATGLSAEEQAKLFRFTLRHSVLLVLFTGCVVLAFAYVFHFN